MHWERSTLIVGSLNDLNAGLQEHMELWTPVPWMFQTGSCSFSKGSPELWPTDSRKSLSWVQLLSGMCLELLRQEAWLCWPLGSLFLDFLTLFMITGDTNSIRCSENTLLVPIGLVFPWFWCVTQRNPLAREGEKREKERKQKMRSNPSHSWNWFLERGYWYYSVWHTYSVLQSHEITAVYLYCSDSVLVLNHIFKKRKIQNY
jgi:hypothetical protein